MSDRITVATGPAFGELRTLAELLELSTYLVKPTATEEDLDRVHGGLEALLLGVNPMESNK